MSASSRQDSSAVDAILRWLWETTPPPDVMDRARLVLLDTLACAWAGMRRPEVEEWIALLARWCPGSVALPGMAEGMSIDAAARVLGVAACWDEANEGLAAAHGRPGLSVVPIAVAMGVRHRMTLGSVLEATVAGYELAARAGIALRPPAGVHVDGAWGALGAATAAARLLDFDATTAGRAVRAAACQIPVALLLPLRTGGTIRNTYGATAAVQGFHAALATAAGFGAPETAVDELGTRVLGRAGPWPPRDRWLISDGYFKLHAGARHLHYAVDAALRWRQRHPHRVPVAVHVTTYDEAVAYCGNRAPETTLQAQFSLSHAVAWALMHGSPGPEAFDAAALRDEHVRRLEARVEVRASDDTPGRYARVAVVCDAGRDDVIVTAASGDPSLPLAVEDIRAKSIRLASSRFGPLRAERLVDGLLNAAVGDAFTDVFGVEA